MKTVVSLLLYLETVLARPTVFPSPHSRVLEHRPSLEDILANIDVPALVRGLTEEPLEIHGEKRPMFSHEELREIIQYMDKYRRGFARLHGVSKKSKNTLKKKLVCAYTL